MSDRATPLTLETQCSERVWRLYDGSHAEAGACGPGIHGSLSARPPKFNRSECNADSWVVAKLAIERL